MEVEQRAVQTVIIKSNKDRWESHQNPVTRHRRRLHLPSPTVISQHHRRPFAFSPHPSLRFLLSRTKPTQLHHPPAQTQTRTLHCESYLHHYYYYR